MKIFGLNISRTKAAVGPIEFPPFAAPWGLVREPFSGAWQRDMEMATNEQITAFSAVYACIDLIANDIAKLRIKLIDHDANGVPSEVRGESPFWRVLRKPNRYQTRFQFVHYWITTKLTYGNAFILKEREANRGIVRALYPLDPRLVTTLVADDGSVWYDLKHDKLSGLEGSVLRVPASEIIHDRCATLYHPLIGVSPLWASAASATHGIRIQANMEKFFRNMSAPSGHLSAVGKIDNVTADRLRRDFESAKGGDNLGRVLVTGDGMKYEPFTMPASDSQLIEQLQFTAVDVSRPFHVPLHKINAALPQVGNMAALNQDYYAQALQPHCEAAENLLVEGLGLDNVEGKTLGIEFDLEGLLRMDPLSRAERNAKEIGAGYLKPNEARASEGRGEVTGGDEVYLQQQNYSLAALAKRDAKTDPFATSSPQPAEPAAPAPAAANDEAAEAVARSAAALELTAKALTAAQEKAQADREQWEAAQAVRDAEKRDEIKLAQASAAEKISAAADSVAQRVEKLLADAQAAAEAQRNAAPPEPKPEDDIAAAERFVALLIDRIEHAE